MALVDAQSSLVPASIGTRTGTLQRTAATQLGRASVATPADNAAFGQRQARQAIREAERANESIQEWNQEVCNVLRKGTGIQLGSEPEAWWNWWNDYNYIKPQLKPTDYYRQSTVDAPSMEVVPERPPCECLVPGTLISTDQGLIPIEEVRRGDLVLSQHPRTAELTYRPVLELTIRDDAETHRVTLEQDSFTATSGHSFWVVGKGWVKTRDLEPGQSLHTANGETRIVTVEPAEPAQTYNLAVSSFNTYFVGASRILSHDVTIPTPVDHEIPGQPLKFKKPDYASR